MVDGKIRLFQERDQDEYNVYAVSVSYAILSSPEYPDPIPVYLFDLPKIFSASILITPAVFEQGIRGCLI